jgi:hypothetical protein
MHGWQVVRRPQWWRRDRKKAPSHQRHSQKFLEKLSGSRFNCLNRDHKRTHCRDSAKCWVCNQRRHTSPFCNQKLVRKTSFPLSPLPRNHFALSSPSTSPTLQPYIKRGLLMEHRRSFDAAPTMQHPRTRGQCRQGVGCQSPGGMR